ncbi:response regulator transcription factor [Pectinatus haikarae]|uniref:response regulator transcription factor n=1 Tax=Pectinatus haikarae TaxID=349096 RepID=UPI0018C5FE5A|nr:response regulator transcription factor [Pectinatus haikarae]
MKILLAEDDSKLSKMLGFLLKKEGYNVDIVDNGEDAIGYLSITNYDVVLLDWMMPGKSGIDVCVNIRQSNKNCGIIMLTAKDTLDDRITGLDKGADDYIVKPFEFPELLARIRAVLRRQDKQYTDNIISLDGELKIDRTKFTAYLHEKDLQLTRREFQLLSVLLQNKGTTLPREQIINKIWNDEDGISSNALDALIKLLRKKLADAGKHDLIKTVHGIGYKIEE